ncbi:MAG: hypothetical protein HQK94_18950 [Nitrospirae bacterium]|nr:hypothetical protein [Nitrospirota bacterium]
MVTKTMKDFMSMASKFVENKHGMWDNAAWLDFISDTQKKGMKMCDDTKTCAGAVLEAMKKYYLTMMETKGIDNIMGEVMDNTITFLKDTKGTWNHDQWEAYLKSMQAKGIEMNTEAKNYLGAVVEASKQMANIGTMK